MDHNTTLFYVAIARSLVSLSCVIGAAIVAAKGKEGWGWFLFAAIMLGCFSYNGTELNP